MEWKAKCLEVSGKISNFALVNWKRAPACSRHALLTACEVLRTLSFDGSTTMRQPFWGLTRTFIFVRGATHVVTCQLETGTALQATSPIDCVRGC